MPSQVPNAEQNTVGYQLLDKKNFINSFDEDVFTTFNFVDETITEVAPSIVKRGRGRPKGSKNKAPTESLGHSKRVFKGGSKVLPVSQNWLQEEDHTVEIETSRKKLLAIAPILHELEYKNKELYYLKAELELLSSSQYSRGQQHLIQEQKKLECYNHIKTSNNGLHQAAETLRAELNKTLGLKLGQYIFEAL